MPDTLNFEWTLPTVGGSDGAWGQILNDAFDDIDADLQTVADAAGGSNVTTAVQEDTGVSGTYTMDLDVARNFDLDELAGGTTFAFDNVPATGLVQVILRFRQGGSVQIVNWPAAIDFARPDTATPKTAPSTPTYGPSASYTFRFTTIDGGTTWIGEYMANGFA